MLACMGLGLKAKELRLPRSGLSGVSGFRV